MGRSAVALEPAVERVPLAQKLSYTVADIAARTHLEETSIWERIKVGDLPAYKDGRRTFVLHDDLTAYLRRHQPAREQKSAQ